MTKKDIKQKDESTKHRMLPRPSEIKNYLDQHVVGQNKAKKAVSLYDYIQTVDSIRLAEKINSSAKNIQKQQNVFLQINIADQKEKKGFYWTTWGTAMVEKPRDLH